jgi:hypothetical protein
MSAAIESQPIQNNAHLLFGGLTPRRAAFVDYYLKTQNATESARLAGYKQTEEALAVTGYRLLRSAKVQAELRRRLKKHILSADQVLESLSNHAKADIADVLEPDGSFDLGSAKRRGKSSLLRKLKVKHRYEKAADGELTPVIEHEFELHDAQSALKTLAQYHGLLIERSENLNLNLTLVSDEERQVKMAEIFSRLEARAIEAQTEPAQISSGDEK